MVPAANQYSGREHGPTKDGVAQHPLTVHEILRHQAGAYIARYPSQAPPHVQSTLAKLSLCRTAALGGHWYACDTCQTEMVLANSCGDRHCPLCRGASRRQWVDSAQRLLLDGVDYYQVVFTIPTELSSLALGNRRAIYNLLFESSWKAVSTTVSDEQGYQPAALMVLHTWNQQLDAHAHVHAVVPGGGPSIDRDGGWKRTERFGRPTSEYLVDEAELRRRFRDTFLQGLRRLHAKGDLKLEGDFACLADSPAWDQFVSQLAETTWVVYIEPPPLDFDGKPCDSAALLKYLARYLAGGPMSDQRLINVDRETVTFWARAGAVAGGESEQVPVSLPVLEFVRRWCLHILPREFTKTRRYGGWSNRHCEAYVERCAILLESQPLSDAAVSFDLVQAIGDGDDAVAEGPCCPDCGALLRRVLMTEKPPWRDIFASADCPRWYIAAQRRIGYNLPVAAREPIESARDRGEIVDCRANGNTRPLGNERRALGRPICASLG